MHFCVCVCANVCVPAGLIDSCVEQMKQSQAQLHLQSIRPGKASQRKRVSMAARRVAHPSYGECNAFSISLFCQQVA